jgi:2'-5' RNA ligase
MNVRTVSNTTRYFVALLPPVDVAEYAIATIQSLCDRYRMGTAKAPPHITVQPPFLWEAGAIAQVEDCLYAFVAEQPSVSIQISGFGCFPPRVLYLNVLETTDLMALQNGLRLRFERQLGIVNRQEQQRGFHPHMTVASRRVKPIFRPAWAQLQAQTIEFEWVGDRLTLFAHDGEQWQVRSAFHLNHAE